jgi:hypothetical protein
LVSFWSLAWTSLSVGFGAAPAVGPTVMIRPPARRPADTAAADRFRPVLIAGRAATGDTLLLPLTAYRVS